MWQHVITEEDILHFIGEMHGFHDGCLKEMKYTSGAYVDENLYMRPVNTVRRLNLIIQIQNQDCSMIEMEFTGVKRLNLYPVDEEYTCEITGASLFIKDGDIYWCDQEIAPEDVGNYCGDTLICATSLRWRQVHNRMGPEAFYQ